MSWRSIVISQPAQLAFAQKAMQIIQGEGIDKKIAKIPLEGISILVIDQPQVSLSSKLLSACAEAQIAVITVGENHLPNGVLLPYLSHSRALKVMRAQLNLSLPTKKRLWQRIIQQKIRNQAAILTQYQKHIVANRLNTLANTVRSGDSENLEGQAAQAYFPGLFGENFFRHQDRFL